LLRSVTLADSGFPLIEVAGSAYEMGYQHGAQAAELIERYIRWIETLTDTPRAGLATRAMAFAPLMQALSPSLMDEVHGLADGACISLGEAMLCQVRVETAHIPLAKTGDYRSEGGCTLFALTGSATADGQPLAGQNLDLEPEYADIAILLHVRPNDGRPRALMLTFAGQVGYNGMNQYGLAHFNASLYDYEWRLATPRQLLRRVMLEKRTVGECVDLLARQRACSAANIVLCDGQGNLADVEIRPEGIALFTGDHPDCRLHTNHYLTAEFAAYESGFVPDSRRRLARLQELVQQDWGNITMDTLKAMLADHQGGPAGICRHGASDWHSIAGCIAEPATGRLHVRRGYGCLGTWQAYEV
jgi:isopenicillin-N N-acyltransferase-like protein